MEYVKAVYRYPAYLTYMKSIEILNCICLNNYMQVRKQQLELDMAQQTGSK